MARATGSAARLYARFETAYGVAPGGDYTRLPFLGGFDLSAEQVVERIDVLGLGRGPGPTDRGGISDRGTVPVPVDPRALGVWLKGLLGAPATGGSGTYTHVFGGDGPPADLPSLSVLVMHPDVPRYHRHDGVVVDRLTLPLSLSDQLTARIAVIAQAESNTTADAAGSPTTLALTPFARLSGTVSADGTPLGRVVGGEVTIGNGSTPAVVIRADGKIDGVDPGIATATGRLELRFAEDDLFDAAVAGTPVALTIAYTIDADTALTVALPQVQLPRPKRVIDGPGGLQVAFPFEAETPELGAFCTVTLKNDVASY